jgi:hypothetical protein
MLCRCAHLLTQLLHQTLSPTQSCLCALSATFPSRQRLGAPPISKFAVAYLFNPRASGLHPCLAIITNGPSSSCCTALHPPLARQLFPVALPYLIVLSGCFLPLLSACYPKHSPHYTLLGERLNGIPCPHFRCGSSTVILHHSSRDALPFVPSCSLHLPELSTQASHR